MKVPMPLLLTVYGISGVVSLAYEVLWIRMLSLQFGVSIFGVVITVAVFMAGLGLGCLLAQRWVVAVRRPILVYGIIELIIAFSAMSIPWFMSFYSSSLNDLSAQFSLPLWYGVQFFVAFLVLMIPAALMGAGFPFVLQGIKADHKGLSRFYGVNALGATLGALLPLVLLPLFGWLVALQIISLLGVVIAIIAIVISSKFPNPVIEPGGAKTEFVSTLTWRILFAYAIIGAAALMLEVAWARLFGMLMLRTEYVVAIILSVFVFGIGAGSILSRYLYQKFWMAALPTGIGAFAILSLWLMPVVGATVDGLNPAGLFAMLLKQGVLLVAVTLPVTLALGAWFPMLTRAYDNNSRSGALLYGVNSVGGAVGALFAGLVITPLFGSNIAIILAAILIVVTGVLIAGNRYSWLVLPLLLLAVYPVKDNQPVSQLLPVRYAGVKDLFVHEDALAITHVVEKQNGQRMLLSDLQRMDASSDPSSVENQKNQARLPLLLHAAPRSIVFLGLGTGITAAGSMAISGLNRTAVELSEGAIEAAKIWFKPVNNNVMDSLTIIRDDARHFLMSTPQKFDVIVGDLFHPDLIGRSALLSVQQFTRAKNRLNTDGVFVQWLALNQFDITSLEIVLRTFKQVFPDAQLFVDGFRLALVGNVSGFQGAASFLVNKKNLDSITLNEITGNEGVWTWLGRYWGPVTVANGVVQDEWKPQIEFRLPRARYSGDLDLVKLLDYLLKRRPKLNQAAEMLNIGPLNFEPFERAFIATDLAYRSWMAVLQRQNEESQRLLKLAFQANKNDRWIGFAVADQVMASVDSLPGNDKKRKLLQAILAIRPDHADALQSLWLLERSLGNEEQALLYQDLLQNLNPLLRILQVEAKKENQGLILR